MAAGRKPPLKKLLGLPLTGLVEVRPEDRNTALLRFICQFGSAGAYVTSRTVADSLFLSQIGPAKLPAMFMVAAGAVAWASILYGSFARRHSLREIVRYTLVGCTLVSFCLVEFQWKVAAADQLARKEAHLTTYFGYFYAVIFCLVGLTQLTLTGPLLRRLGAFPVLRALPLAYCLTSIGTLVTSVERVLLTAVTCSKGCDILRRGLHDRGCSFCTPPFQSTTGAGPSRLYMALSSPRPRRSPRSYCWRSFRRSSSAIYPMPS